MLKKAKTDKNRISWLIYILATIPNRYILVN